MGINWRSNVEIDEENRYGSSRESHYRCGVCGDTIRDDDWKGGPVTGYVCSRCLREDDLRHDADLERK